MSEEATCTHDRPSLLIHERIEWCTRCGAYRKVTALRWESGHPIAQAGSSWRVPQQSATDGERPATQRQLVIIGGMLADDRITQEEREAWRDRIDKGLTFDLAVDAIMRIEKKIEERADG